MESGESEFRRQRTGKHRKQYFAFSVVGESLPAREYDFGQIVRAKIDLEKTPAQN
jgi:hypothetical protein